MRLAGRGMRGVESAAAPSGAASASRAVPAHGVTADGCRRRQLAGVRGRHHFRQLGLDVGVHLVVVAPLGLRGVHVEAGARAKVVPRGAGRQCERAGGGGAAGGVAWSHESSAPSICTPRGEVSGMTTHRPSCDAARAKPLFWWKFSSVHVRPESQYTTGTGAAAACGGM